MEIKINGMCRGDNKASISFDVIDVAAGNDLSFSVGLSNAVEIPFQAYGAGSVFEKNEITYVINVPLLRGALYHLRVTETDELGRDISTAEELISSNSLRWRSRYAYRFQKDLAREIRDIDHSSRADRTDFTVAHVVFQPDENFEGAMLMMQGMIIPKCIKSDFKVYCMDDRGRIISDAFFIEEAKNRSCPEESSRSFRRIVDYSVSFESDCKTLFVVVEEEPIDSREGKPQIAMKAFDVKKLWERANREPVNRREMPAEETHNDWFIGRHKRSETELEFQRNMKFEYNPLISILVPLYKTPRMFLFEMVESVVNQTYGNWELCLANASPEDEALCAALESIKEKCDARIKYIDLEDNSGISANTNQALKHATGEFVTLVDHDDVLELDALYEIVKAVNTDSEIDMLYSDEDHMISETGVYYLPNIKSDFNIDFLRCCNYITHLTTIRRSIVEEVGGFDPEYDGAQDFDIILKSSEKSRVIHHIPRILYHWREHENSTASNISSKPYAIEAGRKAVESHLKRIGIPAKVENSKWPCIYKTTYQVADCHSVSVIIANQFGASDTDRWIFELLSQPCLERCELLWAKRAEDEAEDISVDSRIKILYCEGDLPARLNEAAKQAGGEYLLFLDSGMVPLSADFIDSMLGYSLREDVGAVGAKSYYSDKTIEHAGIALSAETITLNMFRGMTQHNAGFQARALCSNDVAAVSSACLMTPKSTFDSMGGFAEEFTSHFYDVDYCLRLDEKGLLSVFDANAEILHHCIKHPGLSVESTVKWEKDRAVFCNTWAKKLAKGDRFLSPNVSAVQPYWNLP